MAVARMTGPLLKPIAKLTSGNTTRNRFRLYASRDNRSCGDHRAITDNDTIQYAGAGTDPTVLPDLNSAADRVYLANFLVAIAKDMIVRDDYRRRRDTRVRAYPHAAEPIDQRIILHTDVVTQLDKPTLGGEYDAVADQRPFADDDCKLPAGRSWRCTDLATPQYASPAKTYSCRIAHSRSQMNEAAPARHKP